MQIQWTWRRVLLVVLLVAGAAYFVVAAVKEMRAPEAGVHDFGVYYRAAVAITHGGRLYATPPACCFNVAAMTGYTYPPVFAALLIPLTWLPVDDAGRVWLVVCYVSLLVVLLAGVRAAPQPLDRESILWLGVVFLVAGSVAFALYEMQATPLVVALEAIFALCVIRNRFVFVGGLCLALAAAFKVSPILIAPAILLLPRPGSYRALAGLIGGLVATGLLSLALTHEATDYVFHVLPSFSGGVVSLNNLSLPGVILRALVAAGLHPAASLDIPFLTLEIAALVATWLLCRGIGGAAGRALMIAGLLAVVPIVQGVTWDHHLIADILVLILMVPYLRTWSPAWVLAVGGTIVATANQHVLENWLATHGVAAPYNAFTYAAFVAAASCNLIGMCGLWIAVVITARRMRAGAAADPRPGVRVSRPAVTT